jgi:hypothetical protein
MIKYIKWTGLILMLALIILSIFVYSNLKDRNPGYLVDLEIKPTESGIIKAGFSSLPITPEIPEQWHDANKDSQYDPKDGDTFIDRNGNGVFDAVWMAGFHNKRAASGIHDDLWARTIVLDDGNTRLALTVIDAIGLFHDDIIDVRNKINPGAGITYSIVSSTHTHEAPDLMGLWGTGFFKSGIDTEYLAYVKNQIVRSIETAASDLHPVNIRFAQDLTSLSTLVTDTRKPMILDDGLRLMQIVKMETQETLGTLVAWANHPETL